MKNRENYNDIVKFVKKEAKNTKKQGYFVYDILNFLLEIKDNLVDGKSKIANQIYENKIEYRKGDNTYNYSSNINNNIDYRIYNINNEIYIKLKVHKYGDIRANYTDEIILKFDTEYEFYELLNDTTIFLKTVNTEAGEVFLECNIFDEIIEIMLNTPNYTDYSNNLDADFSISSDTIEKIKEKLNKYFSKQ